MLHTLRQHRTLVLLKFTKHGNLPNIVVPIGVIGSLNASPHELDLDVNR
jgi:hypothetical protein